MAAPKRSVQPGQARKATASSARGVRRPRASLQAPTKFEPARWPRRVAVSGVVVAALFGAFGWYSYLSRPSVVKSSPALRPAATRETDRVSGPMASAPGVSAARAGEEVATPPRGLSARELEEWLRSHPEGTDAFDRYRNYEVDWAGIVESTTRADHLLRIEFRDSEGVRILAWCLSDADVSPGSRVTVRARVTQRGANGFVIDRCREVES